MVNKKMVHLLRGYCNKHPKLRDEQLHYAQHAYICAMHYSIQRSLFDICLGYFPKSPMDISFKKKVKWKDKMMLIKLRGSIRKSNKYIRQYKSN